MRTNIVVLTASALLVQACAQGGPVPVTRTDGRAPPTTPDISVSDLRLRLSIIADDSMEGRAAGSVGFARAQSYVERELRRLGVEPAGENGGYTQAFRSIVKHVGPSSIRGDGKADLEVWKDFLPLPWRWRPRRVEGATVVYGGVLGDESISPDHAADKFVILRPRAGTPFPRVGVNDPLRRAAAVALVGFENYPPARLAVFRRGLDAGLEGDAAQRDSAPVSMMITTAAAEALLGKPINDAHIGDVGVKVRGSVAFTDSVVTTCCNVIGVVRGSDLTQRQEFVALGAHLDHLGVASVALDHDSVRAAKNAEWTARGRTSAGPRGDARAIAAVNMDSLRAAHPTRRDSIYNGADDDGSGSAALLELAESLASLKTKPARSVVFVWHTGEELGDLGSHWFTDHPTLALDSIVA